MIDVHLKHSKYRLKHFSIYVFYKKLTLVLSALVYVTSVTDKTWHFFQCWCSWLWPAVSWQWKRRKAIKTTEKQSSILQDMVISRAWNNVCLLNIVSVQIRRIGPLPLRGWWLYGLWLIQPEATCSFQGRQPIEMSVGTALKVKTQRQQTGLGMKMMGFYLCRDSFVLRLFSGLDFIFHCSFLPILK